jgi:hypothetical protein
MSVGPDKDSDTMPSQLRLLAGIRPPEALRDKLIASIPSAAAREFGRGVARHWPRAMSWVGMAAAAVIVLVAVLRFLPPAGRSLPSVADINDSPTMAALADANVPRPRDSNVYDNNAL